MDSPRGPGTSSEESLEPGNPEQAREDGRFAAIDAIVQLDDPQEAVLRLMKALYGIQREILHLGQMKKALYDSRKKLNDIGQSMSPIGFERSITERIQSWNEHYGRDPDIGYPRDAVLSSNPDEVYKALSDWQKSLDAERAYICEVLGDVERRMPRPETRAQIADTRRQIMARVGLGIGAEFSNEQREAFIQDTILTRFDENKFKLPREDASLRDRLITRLRENPDAVDALMRMEKEGTRPDFIEENEDGFLFLETVNHAFDTTSDEDSYVMPRSRRIPFHLAYLTAYRIGGGAQMISEEQLGHLSGFRNADVWIALGLNGFVGSPMWLNVDDFRTLRNGRVRAGNAMYRPRHSSADPMMIEDRWYFHPMDCRLTLVV